MFHPWTLPPSPTYILCHWATAFGLTRAANRLFPSAGPPFLSRAPLLRYPKAFCLGTTADIRIDPFQYNITSIDRRTGCRIWQVVIKTCGNLCFILHIGSRGCQRHGWTLNPSKPWCFNMFQTRSVLRWWWQRHAPKSRLLNFRGTLKTGTWDEKSREIPCPSKLKEPEISNFNSSKHATLNCNYYCYCRWKTVVKTVATSAEAPSRRCAWRPPRPSPPTAAWRSPRGRGMLQNAAEWDLSTAGVGGTTCGGWRLWAPGPLLLRMSTAAPFARRKATTAVWS